MKGFANRDMLQRCLGNLIRNAIQHAGEAGKVTVRAWREASDLVLAVSDSGVALAREVGEQAFTAEGQLSTKNVAGRALQPRFGPVRARVAANVAGARVRSGPAGEARFELCVTGR